MKGFKMNIYDYDFYKRLHLEIKDLHILNEHIQFQATDKGIDFAINTIRNTDENFFALTLSRNDDIFYINYCSAGKLRLFKRLESFIDLKDTIIFIQDVILSLNKENCLNGNLF
jgi:hypothetical protein